MKPYLVFMTLLGGAYETEISSLEQRGGRIEEFDDLASAKSFAEKEKRKWHLVSVKKRIKEGEGKLEDILQYMHGNTKEK